MRTKILTTLGSSGACRGGELLDGCRRAGGRGGRGSADDVDRPADLRARRRPVRGRHAGGHHLRARARRQGQWRRARHAGRRRDRPEDRRAARHRREGDHRHRPGRASAHEERLHLGDARPGHGSKPALLRVDGAGKIEVVSFENLKHTKVALPNAPNAGTNPQRDPRQQSITDMAFIDGRLYVAGLSNEEFASKLRSVTYPFARPTTAPASRSSTAITASSRRGRRSTRSCRTRSTTRRTSSPATCARRW